MTSVRIHPAWLPIEAFRAVGSRRVLVDGDGPLADTVRDEVTRAGATIGHPADLVLALAEPAGTGEGFLLCRRDDTTTVLADGPAGLLYGFYEVVRRGEAAFAPDLADERHDPELARRILDHWDNIDVHPVMGPVERGYAGGSLLWGGDLARVREYGRLLAATGINAITVNNVNVHAGETRLLTDRLGDVEALATVLRPYGIRVHLSVSFAAPVVLGDLPTADPLDVRVREWWERATRRVFETIPDFGGYLVKAGAEGQPGPFTYGRSHADGANMLGEALAPFGATVRWRAFVHDHRQDWRDRATDRAKTVYDHFAPLDGRFRDNVIIQVKHGPIDFQVREPVSPVLFALRSTWVAVELQATQEYTGQQRHVCYLAPMWSGVLRDAADRVGCLTAVSNVGDDPFWTGHPLAQANLYAVGRLAWTPSRDPLALLGEWIDLTFPDAPARLRQVLSDVMERSWETYEQYTAPLGVGFMVRPGDHYGPDIDGHEYTPWGTYHFADRDGVGVDRTRATGTGFTGQYPKPWSEQYESVITCPDELLLFFHHVPYGHVLHSGVTVIQHIYDTHFAGAARVAEMVERWREVAELADPALHSRVAERLDEQLRSAREWRDQINAYFFRKSGVPDAHGRTIH